MSGNPQGKGLVPVLEHWREAQPSVVVARSAQDLSRDYLVSSLVLSAEFHFMPRPGVPYFLYLADTMWQLSLVSPIEWRGRAPGPCLGRCELRLDMTWQLTPSADVGDHSQVVEALEAFQRGCFAWLDADGTLEDNLPYYVHKLPYYRRLLAAGMASSLRQSLARSGLDGRPSREWLAGESLAPMIGE